MLLKAVLDFAKAAEVVSSLVMLIIAALAILFFSYLELRGGIRDEDDD